MEGGCGLWCGWGWGCVGVAVRESVESGWSGDVL